MKQTRNRKCVNTTETFWQNVNKTDNCWLWTSYKDRDGYGLYSYQRKKHRAHRLSWEFANNQPFPTGLIARHKCHNPSCVNPEHIIPGTPKQNWDDSEQIHRTAIAKQWADPNRKAKQLSTHCKPHKTPYGTFGSMEESIHHHMTVWQNCHPTVRIRLQDYLKDPSNKDYYFI